MENPSTYDKAKERVEEKLGFYSHIAAYVVVNLILIFVNLTQSPNELWFYWPLGGWGIGVFFHGMSTFVWGEGSSIKERMIEKEMEKRGAAKE
ncbi:MAG: 2TM domain-containing protein [Candidatus Eisenbacteria bacterium]